MLAPMATKKRDPRITKRRVTMRSVRLVGEEQVEDHAVDFVRPDHLDAYVADARTRWQSVEVSEEPDAGPAGYHGQTHVPAHLPLPDAGVTYAATEED
jgi:hypothetical protein